MKTEEKKLYLIEIDGCDDTTAFRIGMTESEYDFLEKIAEESKRAATSHCKPTMNIIPQK